MPLHQIRYRLSVPRRLSQRLRLCVLWNPMRSGMLLLWIGWNEMPCFGTSFEGLWCPSGTVHARTQLGLWSQAQEENDRKMNGLYCNNIRLPFIDSLYYINTFHINTLQYPVPTFI
mmetsp:Transcript_3220/g.5076  ORF Transcript_3220/g.5076 Transcript_3220/m.5076 type:complete len:116 (+) Transcript_3220:356-703(+)